MAACECLTFDAHWRVCVVVPASVCPDLCSPADAARRFAVYPSRLGGRGAEIVQILKLGVNKY